MPILSGGPAPAGVPSTTICASYLIVTTSMKTPEVFRRNRGDRPGEVEADGHGGMVPVVTGFVGATRDGVITTLGAAAAITARAAWRVCGQR